MNASTLPAVRLYTVAEAVELMKGRPAEKFEVERYMRRLRAGEFPGHRDGRQWVLTLGDIEKAVEVMAVPASVPVPDAAGLTRTSRRRLTRGGR